MDFDFDVIPEEKKPLDFPDYYNPDDEDLDDDDYSNKDISVFSSSQNK